MLEDHDRRAILKSRFLRRSTIQLLVASLLLALSWPQFAQGVPAEARAVMLQQDVYDALKAAPPRKREALEKIAEIRTLGVPVAPPLLVLEAKLAQSSSDPLRAKSALESYFKAVGPQDPQYNEAAQLLRQVEPAAAQAEKRSEDEAARLRSEAEIRSLDAMLADAKASLATGDSRTALERAEKLSRQAAGREPWAAAATVVLESARAGERERSKKIATSIAAAIRSSMVSIPAGEITVELPDGLRGYDSKTKKMKATIRPFRMMADLLEGDILRPYCEAGDLMVPLGGGSAGKPAQQCITSVNLGTKTRPTSIADVERFLEWLNRESGATFRRPTLAEWLWAASAGGQEKFPWGTRGQTSGKLTTLATLLDSCPGSAQENRSGLKNLACTQSVMADVSFEAPKSFGVGSYRVDQGGRLCVPTGPDVGAYGVHFKSCFDLILGGIDTFFHISTGGESIQVPRERLVEVD